MIYLNGQTALCIFLDELPLVTACLKDWDKDGDNRNWWLSKTIYLNKTRLSKSIIWFAKWRRRETMWFKNLIGAEWAGPRSSSSPWWPSTQNTPGNLVAMRRDCQTLPDSVSVLILSGDINTGGRTRSNSQEDRSVSTEVGNLFTFSITRLKHNSRLLCPGLLFSQQSDTLNSQPHEGEDRLQKC